MCVFMKHFVHVSIAAPRANQLCLAELGLSFVSSYIICELCALACRGPVVCAEWPQLAFGCRTLWTRISFIVLLGLCACVRVCVRKMRRKYEWKCETRKEKKKLNINETSSPTFPRNTAIPTTTYYYCYLLWFARSKDMLKVEKEKKPK